MMGESICILGTAPSARPNGGLRAQRSRALNALFGFR